MALVVRPGLGLDRDRDPWARSPPSRCLPGLPRQRVPKPPPLAWSGASARCTSSSERAPTRLRPARPSHRRALSPSPTAVRRSNPAISPLRRRRPRARAAQGPRFPPPTLLRAKGVGTAVGAGSSCGVRGRSPSGDVATGRGRGLDGVPRGLQTQPILVGDSPSSLQYLTRQAEPANRHSDHEQNSTQAIRYMDRLLTADELAERLGMKTEWVWSQARAGRIPHVRLGRYRRFRESAVDAWSQDLETGGSGRLATLESDPIPLRRRA